MNPAQTGNFNGTNRFILNNKTQWNSVSVPYSTSSLSTDMIVNGLRFKQNLFGAGLIINRDEAGDSQFGTTQVKLDFSILVPIDEAFKHILSFAIENGISQININYSKLKLDNQWDGTKYDPNIGINETFSTKNFFYYDLSTGICWKYSVKPGMVVNSGIALFHLTKPNRSFFNDNNVSLNRKLTLFANSEIKCNKEIDLLPSVYTEFQGVYREVLLGSACRYIFNDNKKDYKTALFGLYTRVGDALIIMVGSEFKNTCLTLSYDVNYSKLHVASNLRGGFEIALRYIIDRPKPERIRTSPCLIY